MLCIHSGMPRLNSVIDDKRWKMTNHHWKFTYTIGNDCYQLIDCHLNVHMEVNKRNVPKWLNDMCVCAWHLLTTATAVHICVVLCPPLVHAFVTTVIAIVSILSTYNSRSFDKYINKSVFIAIVLINIMLYIVHILQVKSSLVTYIYNIHSTVLHIYVANQGVMKFYFLFWSVCVPSSQSVCCDDERQTAVFYVIFCNRMNKPDKSCLLSRESHDSGRGCEWVHICEQLEIAVYCIQ